MTLGKIGLQPQSLIRSRVRFLPPRRRWLIRMIYPAFYHGEAGKGSGKVWIELECLFAKLLRLPGIFTEHSGFVAYCSA